MRYSQVIGPGRSEVVEAPDPAPGEGQVRVAVSACGLCASERTGWARHGGGEPTRYGHEVTGRIEELGPAAYGWRVGDLVTGLGDPGYADQMVMKANAILPVPPNVAPEHALGEPLACLVEALSRTPVGPRDRVAIVGLGFMGLGILQLTRLLGPAALVAVDLEKGARETALALGATEAYHPDEVPTEYRSGMTVVIEAAGTAGALATAGELTAQHATLCIVGYHASGPRTMDLDLWHKGVDIINGYTPQRHRIMAAMARGLELIAQRRFSYEPLITHRLGLAEVDTGFGYFADRPAGFIKSVVIP